MFLAWNLAIMLNWIMLSWCRTHQSCDCLACPKSFGFFFCNWVTHLDPHAILMDSLALINDMSAGGYSVVALLFLLFHHNHVMVVMPVWDFSLALTLRFWLPCFMMRYGYVLRDSVMFRCVMLGHCDETRRWNVFM